MVRGTLKHPCDDLQRFCRPPGAQVHLGDPDPRRGQVGRQLRRTRVHLSGLFDTTQIEQPLPPEQVRPRVGIVDRQHPIEDGQRPLEIAELGPRDRLEIAPARFARVKDGGLRVALVSRLQPPAHLVGHSQGCPRLGRTRVLARRLQQAGELFDDSRVGARKRGLDRWRDRRRRIASGKAPPQRGQDQANPGVQGAPPRRVVGPETCLDAPNH